MRAWIAATATMVMVTTASAANWREARSPHFVIFSQEDAGSLRSYGERLERFDALLRLLQPADAARPPSPADRVTIFALPSIGAVQSVLGRNSNAAGAYRPSVTGSVAITSHGQAKGASLDAQGILLHEYTHHFMLQNFPVAYAAWFVEGFAEFASTAKFESNGDIGIGLPAQHRAYSLQWMGSVGPEQLMTGKIDWRNGREVSIFYGKAWLLTHYLIFDKARHGQLGTYLRAVADGTPSLNAAKASFGDLAVLDRELTRYAERASMVYLRINAARVPPARVTVRDATPGESATMMMRVNSRMGVGAEEAQTLVKRARIAAAPFPADPAAQCALAEAEDDAGNPDGTDAAADRLLAADPKSVCGMMFKGHAGLARARAAGASPDDAAWAKARSWFSRANRADVEQPWPMAMFYRSYRIAKARPTDNAVAALLGAQERAPYDPGLRQAATVELLRKGETQQARDMLAPAIGNAHGAGTRARDIFERIGRDDPKMLADQLENGSGGEAGAGKP